MNSFTRFHHLCILIKNTSIIRYSPSIPFYVLYLYLKNPRIGSRKLTEPIPTIGSFAACNAFVIYYCRTQNPTILVALSIFMKHNLLYCHYGCAFLLHLDFFTRRDSIIEYNVSPYGNELHSTSESAKMTRRETCRAREDKELKRRCFGFSSGQTRRGRDRHCRFAGRVNPPPQNGRGVTFHS